MRKLELLAPAKNLEYGKTAINYGADAVYIGGPMFGARASAGNSMKDIGELVKYAHRYGAKVYMAINTILYDEELEQAKMIATEAWERGVDALIIQDMTFLQMDIPPVPLHASTQTFINEPSKAEFLQHAGFSRLILERALRIDEIKAIRSRTTIGLEVFVHGAICVCYSGQCYMSHVTSGKSGNRGECRQPCRWDYDLVDSGGRKIIDNAHLLSVRDMDMSSHLEKLIMAGVDSFKIEGRLKDMAYLKNTVSYYRANLDRILHSRGDMLKSSYGDLVNENFASDPAKTFSRGFTDYYLLSNDKNVSNFKTPKSVGEYIGKVQSVSGKSFTVKTGKKINNGDGLLFLSDSESVTGTNVNTAEGNTVFPNNPDGIRPGMDVYRNHDHSFYNFIENHNSIRTILVDAELYLSETKVGLRITAPDGVTAEKDIEGVFQTAKDAENNRKKITDTVLKAGGTAYRIDGLRIIREDIFVPASIISALRRNVLGILDIKRLSLYKREIRPVGRYVTKMYFKKLDYRANVTNRLSELFYSECGADIEESGLEKQCGYKGKTVMRTKYCIRREIGECLRKKSNLRGKLSIKNKKHIFDLNFDCEQCEMMVVYVGKNKE